MYEETGIHVEVTGIIGIFSNRNMSSNTRTARCAKSSRPHRRPAGPLNVRPSTR
ncbi:hypothetical protein [Nocardia sp. NPDC052112]|uniref:hypothetical protein n=1 Tax=Nocardia sp. NPDC052112 TaxID=3155646 RepID=UPI00341E0428